MVKYALKFHTNFVRRLNLGTNFITKQCFAAKNTLFPISDQISTYLKLVQQFKSVEQKLGSTQSIIEKFLKSNKKAKTEKSMYYI